MNFYNEIPFVNRYKELRFFSDDISSNINSTVSIIYSRNGVGKSRLCQEILKDVDKISITVKLEVNISKANYLQDGYYIKQLAKTINDRSINSNIVSFEQFLQIISEEDANKLLLTIANDYIEKSPILKNTKDVVSKLFSLGNFDSNKFFETNLNETTKLSYKYIEYICENNYLVINIENIQIIDTTSLDLLSTLLNKINKIYLLLEYTISQNKNYLSLEELQNSFNKKDNNTFHIKELERLDEKELVKLLESNNELLKQYIATSYKQWDGNLRPFVNLHYNLPNNNEEIKDFISNSSNTINNIVLNDLLKLNSKELFLLLLIAVHADAVEINLINQIHNIELISDISTIFDFELELNKLKNKRLLSAYNKTYIINDDTILEHLLSTDFFHSKKIVAIQLWLKIYTLIYQNDNHFFTSKSNLLFKILNFSVQLQEDQYILRYLNELMFLFKHSTPIWVKDWVYKITDSIKSSKNEYLNNLIRIRLSEITESLALYDTSYSLINSVKSNDINLLLAKAILLEKNSKPEETLELINFIYNIHNDLTKKLYLICKIIEISSLRSLNEYKKAENIFKEFINNNEYKEFLEYGFILRLAGTIYDSRKALPYVIQGIKHFNKYNASIQELHTRIELSVMYIYNEDFELARNELTIASEISQNQFIEDYIIDNNLAIINLYQNRDIEKSYLMLKKSLSKVQTPFDKLAIHINLLICANFIKLDEELILTLCQTIDELCCLNNISDIEIKRISYFNLMLSCKILNHLEKFELYKKCFENIIVDGDKYNINKKFKLLINNKLNLLTQENRVREFITCELSHWSIEFDNILKNY